MSMPVTASMDGPPTALHREQSYRLNDQKDTVLPVYTINGILTYHIHQGGIDGPRFEWFLANEVLPLCNPYPGPRSVLIMDNESVHIHPVSLELVLYRLSAN